MSQERNNHLGCPVDLATLESLNTKNCPYILAHYGAVLDRVIFYTNKFCLLFCFSVEFPSIVSLCGTNGYKLGKFFENCTLP